MPTPQNLALFALASVLLALTPGPNVVYLVSRTLCQGRRAGIVSLAGTSLGFVFHVFAAALGLSAIFLTVPVLYDALRYAGAGYLLWLAWDALRPGGAITGWLARRPLWSAVQRWVLGVVLAGIAVRLAFDSRR
jgi:threonine/homoserine/homoserine lactone efflux protein